MSKKDRNKDPKFFETDEGKISIQTCKTTVCNALGKTERENLCLCVFEDEHLQALATIQDDDILPIIDELKAVARQIDKKII